MMKLRALGAMVAIGIAVGCGSSGSHFDSPTGGTDASVGSDPPGPDAATIVGQSDGGGASHDCSPTSLDLEGCSCTTVGATQACYTGDPKTRNVGACKDGTQTCAKNGGEFAAWGPCTGDVTPGPESCTGTVDTNCNGAVGCADPTCANDPSCQTGCTNGQTRSCYTGPSGTENVGVCKDGTQTCVNGQWSQACNGEVTPQPENCCDALDHNCNGLPGCFDLFSCITAACCQTTCNSSNVDPGCVCPQGAGDTATCPQGDHDVHKGGFPGTDECCPCAASDCGDPNCCGEAICAGSSACAGLNCNPLPASCNGQVSADCDDFPEDCDEPCCECSNCP
jgi:hypothetical protein